MSVAQGQVGECCESRRLTAFGEQWGSLVCVALPLQPARGSSAAWMKYRLVLCVS